MTWAALALLVITATGNPFTDGCHVELLLCRPPEPPTMPPPMCLDADPPCGAQAAIAPTSTPTPSPSLPACTGGCADFCRRSSWMVYCQDAAAGEPHGCRCGPEGTPRPTCVMSRLCEDQPGCAECAPHGVVVPGTPTPSDRELLERILAALMTPTPTFAASDACRNSADRLFGAYCLFDADGRQELLYWTLPGTNGQAPDIVCHGHFYRGNVVEQLPPRYIVCDEEGPVDSDGKHRTRLLFYQAQSNTPMGVWGQ